jgi:flagellar biosynthesis/type III secretory pathway M-ring protein FliF/YscJ
MATWIWIVIAVGAVILLLALVFGARRGRERRIVQKREKAGELRQEAQERVQRAEERERIAEEHAQQARDEREQAAEVGARADKLDPDRD